MASHDPDDAVSTRTASLFSADAHVVPLGGHAVIRAGDSVGPYVIDQLCGTGGFGSVFRAHDADGRTVALKILHWHLAEDAEVTARFHQEIEAIRRIRHESIVIISDAGLANDGRPYYAMEWLEGPTLKAELDARGPMTVGEALAILRPLCNGVLAAHAAGVVHRDVKTSNVMLISRGGARLPVLVDFGIAKMFDADTGRSLEHTRSDAWVGSPHIMAPEQIRGSKIDGRTDVYALGALLYSMLTGRVPFLEEDPLELQTMHLESPPPKASAFAPVPSAIDRVIATCMAKAPEDRYASVAELLDALEAIATAGDMHGPSPPAERQSPAFAVHLSARADGDADEVLDAMDDLIEATRATLIEQGFDIVTDTSSGFLALTLLSLEPATARTQRRALLGRLVALARTAAPGVSLHVAAHVGSVTLTRPQDATRYLDGDVLRTQEWTAVYPTSGLVATEEALRGLDQEFALTELRDAPTVRYAIEIGDDSSSS